MDAPTLYIPVLHDAEGNAVESAFQPGAIVSVSNFQDRNTALDYTETLNAGLNSSRGWTWIVLEYAPVPF